MSMKSDKKLIIPILFIFGILFGPNFYIAGVSLRVITSSIGLLLLWLNRADILTNNVFRYFIVYICIYVLVAYLNGDSADEYFYKGLLNWFLPGLLLFLIVPTYVKSETQLRCLCNVIAFIFVFDVLLSIGQFFNLSIAWNIGNTINAHASEFSEYYMERHDVDAGFLGLSIINGMCASVVDNGYFLAVSFPLLFLLKYEADDKVKRASVFVLLFLALFASFAIQQRMGFYLVSLFILYTLWKESIVRTRFIIILLLGFMVLAGVEYIVDNIDLGRIAEASDEDRADTYLRSLSVIFHDSQLFTIGGEKYYRQFFEHTPHNTLIGAWVYTGIFGFVVFVLLLIKVTKQLLPSVFLKLNINNIVQYSLAASCLIFLCYSLTHSTGIHNGKGLYFWLSYGLFCKYQYMKN